MLAKPADAVHPSALVARNLLHLDDRLPERAWGRGLQLGLGEAGEGKRHRAGEHRRPVERNGGGADAHRLIEAAALARVLRRHQLVDGAQFAQSRPALGERGQSGDRRRRGWFIGCASCKEQRRQYRRPATVRPCPHRTCSSAPSPMVLPTIPDAWILPTAAVARAGGSPGFLPPIGSSVAFGGSPARSGPKGVAPLRSSRLSSPVSP